MDEPLRRQPRHYDNAGRVLETESKDGFRPDEKFACLYPSGGQSSPRHTNLSCSVLTYDEDDRFWELNREINHGSLALRKAVNKIHSSLAGEMAGLAHDNTAILLFCEIALGFVPVVGQAMDLYDLGCWG